MSGIPTIELIDKLRPLSISGDLPAAVTGITQDSRRVRKGFIFAARLGGKAAGIDYLNQARNNGAAMLMIEGEAPIDANIPWIKVDRFRSALVTASKEIYRDPSKRLGLYGVTGTNGKTSTVHLLRSIYESAGAKCAMLSTVGYWTGEETQEAPLTTPDIDQSSSLLYEAASTGALYATMEVSSHALDQGRVRGLTFAGAGFTNLSVDHLDYHGNLIEYSIAKERLFRSLPLTSSAAVNIDSSWGCRMVRACWSPVITVGGGDSGAELRVSLINHSVTGGTYQIEWNEKKFEIETPLVGVYQGENIALAAAMAFTQGIDIATVVRGISRLKAVPGRMEAVTCGQPFSVFVDYAHTPDALRKAITSLRHLTSGKILVLFGCGGDRDRSKRPQMGKIAAEGADRVFITSDNPRTEEPTAITSEIFNGVEAVHAPKVTIIVDRGEATLAIIKAAKAGDIVLLAGKGSEWYQEVNGVRQAYDDRLIASEVLWQLGYKEGDKRS